MVDLTPGAILALGFALGAGHALEPDHVAAVGTLVSEQRRIAVSCLLGACWGVGHTLALLAAGIAVLVFRVAMPPGMERGLDMSVALLSIGLGLRALFRLAGSVSLHRHTHSHGGRAHAHYHVHLRHLHLSHLRLPDLQFRADAHEGFEHVHLAVVGGRPVLIGLVHGLAGSAALLLGAIGAIGSPAVGLAYLLAFGAGATAGMLALSGLIGLPFASIAAAGLARPRAEIALAALRALAALASIAVGVALAARLG